MKVVEFCQKIFEIALIQLISECSSLLLYVTIHLKLVEGAGEGK